jgi:hypothetical protein
LQVIFPPCVIYLPLVLYEKIREARRGRGKGRRGEENTWILLPSQRRRITLVVSVWEKESVMHDTTSPRRMPAHLCTSALVSAVKNSRGKAP